MLYLSSYNFIYTNHIQKLSIFSNYFQEILKMNSLKSLGSCKFLLQYHFIFITKYRRKILNEIRDNILCEMMQISKKYDFKIHTQEIDKDHIHLLIETIPRISPSMICRVLKQESTVNLWKKHSQYLCRFYWKERTLWSDGWFCSTIGNVSEKTLRHYIETQGS